MLASALPSVLAQARPTWAEFVAAWALFRDPIITAVAAGVSVVVMVWPAWPRAA